jgi:apolipoprotein N-acyltransferase
MEFGDRAERAGIALSVFAATAVLVYFGNGLAPRWALMWFAPLPVLLFALGRPAWQAGFIAAGAWLAGGLNLWSYFRDLGLAVAWFLYFGMAALVFAAGVVLMRALVRRGAVWSAWLALPAIWVSFEYLRNLLWAHGSATCIAYSQLNFLPFLQQASLTGPLGMGFVLMLFPAGLALSIHLWHSARRQAIAVLGSTLGIVAAVLVFGAARLAIPQPGPLVKVGLVASDVSQGVAQSNAATERLFEEYAQPAQELAARGAQVVVLPEILGVITDPDVPRADVIFQGIADQTGAVVVAGMEHVAGTLKENEARIYAPGVAVRSYDKEHLLPPFENIFTPGTSRTFFEASGKAVGRTWGVAICKDLDFTEPARGYGGAGVGLLMAPAGDFRMDGFWHGHIAVMRAVEDGFSLVRSARRGLLTVADNRGRIVAETVSNAAPFSTLLTTVTAGHNGTLFLLLGDWFGWGAIALLLFCGGRLCRLESFGASGKLGS